MFIDEVKVLVEGGRGGDGCVSFRREMFRPRGGPDGGDGGDGGDVVLVASSSRSTLGELHKSYSYRAEHGTRGGSQNKTGRRGADMERSARAGGKICPPYRGTDRRAGRTSVDKPRTRRYDTCDRSFSRLV